MQVLSTRSISLPVNGASDSRTVELTNARLNEYSWEYVSAKLKVESELELDELANALPGYYNVYENTDTDDNGDIWVRLFTEKVGCTERTAIQTVARGLLFALGNGAADAIGMTGSDAAMTAFCLEDFVTRTVNF